MRIIPRPVHGILDYMMGALLFASPWIFGYVQWQQRSTDFAMIFGGAMVMYTALTNFEAGIVRLIPFPAHLFLDFIAAMALVFSPIIFGVSGVAAVVFVCIGVLELGTALITKSSSDPGGKPHMTA